MIEDGDGGDAIYTDFSKASDSVLHRRLLNKMKDLGMRGTTLKWVEAFLSNRLQKVQVDGECSQSGRR